MSWRANGMMLIYPLYERRQGHDSRLPLAMPSKPHQRPSQEVLTYRADALKYNQKLSALELRSVDEAVKNIDQRTLLLAIEALDRGLVRTLGSTMALLLADTTGASEDAWIWAVGFRMSD